MKKNYPPSLSKSAQLLEFPEVKKVLSQFAFTSLGREKISLLHPLEDLQVIRRCLQQTSEMVQLFEDGHNLILSGVVDFRSSLESVLSQGRVLEPRELLDLAGTIQRGEITGKFLKKLPPEKFPRLHHLSSYFRDHTPLSQEIGQSISNQEAVVDRASSLLAKIRRERRDLEQKIHLVFLQILRDPQKRRALQSEKPVLRGDRLCLSVKSGYHSHIRGILLDSSQTGQTLFIEPERVVSLGNRLAELRRSERNEINRILRRLTTLVLDQREDLLFLLDVLGWVDFTQAKARMSIEHNMYPPQIEENGPLELIQARHPLLLSLLHQQEIPREEREKKVVPLRLTLDREKRILLITGPNTGGKTIALKTVGLLALMAQSGLPIPADPQSRLPLYDKVYASIGDAQNLFSSLSTFSADVKRTVEILEKASASSLVLLDEFGSGTDPEEGSALAEAILNRMATKKHHTIITTHLTFLKKYAYQNSWALNGSVEFDTENLQPTYRLVVGAPGNSQALCIAEKLGMDPQIIKEAQSLLHHSEETQWIHRLQESVFQAEKNRDSTFAIREEIQKVQREILEEKKLLLKKRKTMEQEVEIELESLRRSVILEMEDYLKALPTRGQKKEVQDLRDFLHSALSHTSLENKRLAYARRLKKRKKVFLLSLGTVGTIVKINKAKEELRVQIGSLEVETNFRDVSWIGEIPLLEFGPSGNTKELEQV